MNKLLFTLLMMLSLSMASCKNTKATAEENETVTAIEEERPITETYDYETSDYLVDALNGGQLLTKEQYDTVLDLLDEGHAFCIELMGKYPTNEELDQVLLNDTIACKIWNNTMGLQQFLYFRSDEMTPEQWQNYTAWSDSFKEILQQR